MLLLQIRAIIVTNTCKKSEPFHLASNFQPRSILGDPIHLKPKVVKKFGQLSQISIILKFPKSTHFSEAVDIIPFHPKLSHIFSSRVKIISKENRVSPIIADYRQTWWPPRNVQVGSRSCSKLWSPPLRPGRQKYIRTFLIPHYFVSHTLWWIYWWSLKPWEKVNNCQNKEITPTLFLTYLCVGKPNIAVAPVGTSVFHHKSVFINRA